MLETLPLTPNAAPVAVEPPPAAEAPKQKHDFGKLFGNILKALVIASAAAGPVIAAHNAGGGAAGYLNGANQGLEAAAELLAKLFGNSEA